VFFNVSNDHICTRIEHVSHVESVSNIIATHLGLNTELTRAIATGHDLGHAPFGHEGEYILKKLPVKYLGRDFWHEQNGVRFADKIELLEDEGPAEALAYRLGGCCVIGIPGEAFVEFGLYLKAMAGFGTVIVNELTGGVLPGYMYTPESLVTGGYETDTSMLDEEFGINLMNAALAAARSLR
jgi:hypothetical protein